ncbi:ANK_REP_REGION domain-containing protein, partial [Haematococcus lacustris]
QPEAEIRRSEALRAAGAAYLEASIKAVSAKTYLYATLFIAASAASPVLIKGSLYTMQTPAVLLFLHMLATSLMLWLAAWFEVFPLQPLNLQAVKGAGIRSALGAMQATGLHATAMPRPPAA